MKPGFALILSQDGISLLHRAKGGWRILGKADPQAPDLDQKLRYLQRTATELSGGQFATKIVIPNSQILFRHIEAVGFTDDLRTALIHASLDGATPYALDELVFDWADAGDNMAHVAVVATETLKEAEKFARDHRFNPVSFVALPETDAFSEEPFFGETELSETLLSDGDRVEPDDEPIKIITEPEPNEQPVVTVTEDRATVDEISKPISAPKTENPIADPVTTTATFSTRRDTNQPPHDAGPLDLKWVTPRIAVSTNSKKQIIPEGTEISKLSVTSPLLAGDVRTPKIRLKKTRANHNQTSTGPTKHRTATKLISTRKPLTLETTNTFSAVNPDRPPTKMRLSGVLIGLSAVAALVFVGLFSTGLLTPSGNSFSFWQKPDTDIADLGEELTASAVVASASFIETEPLREDSSPIAGIEIASLSAPDISTIELALPTPEELAENQSVPDSLETLTPDLAQKAYGLTGIWQLAPNAPPDPHADRVDDLYVASIDRAIISQDAVALPAYALSRPDHSLGFITAPAPAGLVFKLDERGLVHPSANGTLSPDGHKVFAGKPAYVPLLRPGSIQPVVETQPVASAEIIGVRPLPRPENLVAKTQNARLGGRTLAEIGKVHPLPRPASPQETVLTDAPTTLSALAINSSRRPTLRPQNFTTTVDAVLASLAVEAAVADSAKNTSPPESNAPVQQASASAATTRSPNIPTRANVAKEATIKNALKLSTINLIGVYGSNADRRALVRLKSGRYVKVQIGDRLDGGRVASIGSGELKYVKSGRNVTLKMPTG